MKRNLAWLTVTLFLVLGDSARATVTGQWDFNSGNLSATVGTALAYCNDTRQGRLSPRRRLGARLPRS